MSVYVANPTAAPSSSSYQPFQCHICQRRFTRHENLKRHAALHSRSADQTSFPCDFCPVTFSRHDLRHRHLKRKHPEHHEKLPTKRRQHDATVARKSRDDLRSQRSKPASASPEEIRYEPHQAQLRDEAELKMDNWVWQMNLPETQQLDQDEQTRHSNMIFPTSAHTTTEEDNAVHDIASWLTQQPTINEPTYIDPYLQNVTNFEQSLPLELSSLIPNFHMDAQVHATTTSQPGFSDATSEISSPSQHIPDGLSSRDVSYLQDDWFPSASQTAKGYHLYFTHVSHFVPFLHRPTFDATETARHLGLSMLCLAYQHGEDPDCNEEAGSGLRLSLRCFHRARVLAASEEERADDLSHNITLIQSYWLLQVCVMMYLCGKESSYGFKMHSRMISLARFGGLIQPMPVKFATTEDLESLWREFIKAESYKRTLLAVHQIDALWYQLFSIPRLLSHLEIKHDLPCQEECWTASSSTQWAHRQLAASQSAPLVPYSDAVRLFLAPNPVIESLPAFDLYGAVNIAQFLLSSAREVSGWSTMTGRLSQERFEPLRSSLVALEHLIRPQAETAKSTHATLCEATWEIAMIELLIWSPSHTCGIVGGSVDAFLIQSTELASSSKISYEAANARAAQPHIDWFLRHLDATPAADSEPPWIALYAYKAFLIAWHLVRGGFPGAMEVVGVHDNDVEGAITWARKVFQRGERRQLSKLISSCLDTLHN